MKTRILAALFLISFAGPVFAQAPEVGREAAARYFGQPAPIERESAGSEHHFLALHFGGFMSGDSWEWGSKFRQRKSGGGSFGLTYRLDEWNNTMDWGLRVDFNEYKVAGEKPLKMSLMPVVTFPDATSKFPLYFGAGLGLGIFFKQVDQESPLALDYQIFMGARFFNVFHNSGFFIETGMKNHLLLTSSGQFNGVFLTGGAVFTF